MAEPIYGGLEPPLTGIGHGRRLLICAAEDLHGYLATPRRPDAKPHKIAAQALRAGRTR
jgi:hypothetical protein